jgi:phosphohistidine phosphatase
VSVETGARLVVVRHAEAGWGGSGSDFQRPLTQRGLEQALRLGQQLAAVGWHPQAVVHSAALRTTQTWRRMAEALEGTPRVVVSQALYHEGPAAYLRAAASCGGQAGTVLLVGHNPVVGELVELLTSQPVRFGTAHAALLEYRSDEAWPGWELGLAVPLGLRLARVLTG